mgnify:FL=1|jgi:hypothetical protein
MKRLISAVLIGIMLVSMLTGCGANELGFIGLMKEITSLTEVGYKNSTKMELLDGASGKTALIDFNIDGELNISDINSMYGAFDIMLDVNGIKLDKPINIIFSEDGLYVSKNALIELPKYEKIFIDLEGYEEVLGYGEILKELYNTIPVDTEYIEVWTMNGEYYQYTEGIDYDELSSVVQEYLTKAFKGFDSKLITKTKNGYSLSLDQKSSMEFIRSLINYLSENKETVFDETIKFLPKLVEITDYEIMTEEDKEELISSLESGRQQVYDVIEQAKSFIESEEFEEHFDSYDEIIGDSSTTYDIYKEKGSYKIVTKAESTLEDLYTIKATSTTELTPKTVKKGSTPDKAIPLEDVEKEYKKIEDRINPIEKIELEWYDDYDNTAYINKYRRNGKAEWDFQTYTIIEDRIYLPLRYIGESFGEEVDWDNENKKAYVIRGEERIDMTGVLLDSKTMIKIRDFEKIGYKIEYSNEDGLSTATIIK